MTSVPTIDQVQIELDETKDILRSNVTKVLERDSKLSDLEACSESLRENASIFQYNSTALRRKMWWQDKRQLILLTFVLICLLLIVILPIALST